MGLFFVLLAIMPLFYNIFNPVHRYVPIIAMANSWLQTTFFLWFVLCLLCTASMLPAGRYYYDIEAGYVGNP
jgi:ABC-type lipoprotein release transport system permease subunit